jgi:hypothetical protein
MNEFNNRILLSDNIVFDRLQRNFDNVNDDQEVEFRDNQDKELVKAEEYHNQLIRYLDILKGK